MIVPLILHRNHWVVAIVDLVNHTYEYYNSMGGEQLDIDGQRIFHNVMRWLVDVGAVVGDDVQNYGRRQSCIMCG